jgi:hypothetical protein
VKGFPTLAPCSGVRWDSDAVQVEVQGTWYGLLAIDGHPAAEIAAFCQRRFPGRWKKRFEEDLVAVLSQMGAAPGSTVTLTLQTLDAGTVVTRQDVAMTAENRQAIWRAAQRRP